jgi:hypothetical protein
MLTMLPLKKRRGRKDIEAKERRRMSITKAREREESFNIKI